MEEEENLNVSNGGRHAPPREEGVEPFRQRIASLEAELKARERNEASLKRRISSLEGSEAELRPQLFEKQVMLEDNSGNADCSGSGSGSTPTPGPSGAAGQVVKGTIGMGGGGQVAINANLVGVGATPQEGEGSQEKGPPPVPPPPPTSGLSLADNFNFFLIEKTCLNSDPEISTAAINSLAEEDPRLTPTLLSRLLRFIPTQIGITSGTGRGSDPQRLTLLLRMAGSIVANVTVDLEKDGAKLFPRLRSCLLAPDIWFLPNLETHFELRDHAAGIIAKLCKRLDSPVNGGVGGHTQQEQGIMNSIMEDPNSSLAAVYGAILGLSQFGDEVVKTIVLPQLKGVGARVEECLTMTHSTEENKVAAQRITDMIVNKLNQSLCPPEKDPLPLLRDSESQSPSRSATAPAPVPEVMASPEQDTLPMTSSSEVTITAGVTSAGTSTSNITEMDCVDLDDNVNDPIIILPKGMKRRNPGDDESSPHSTDGGDGSSTVTASEIDFTESPSDAFWGEDTEDAVDMTTSTKKNKGSGSNGTNLGRDLGPEFEADERVPPMTIEKSRLDSFINKLFKIPNFTDLLSSRDIMSIREVCQDWKTIVNNFFQESNDTIEPNYTNCQSIKASSFIFGRQQSALQWAGIYLHPGSALENSHRLVDFFLRSFDHPGNPFLSGRASFHFDMDDETTYWHHAYQVLEKFGERLRSMRLYYRSKLAPQELIPKMGECLSRAPKLNSLECTFISTWGRRRSVGLHQFPPLENLRRLSVDYRGSNRFVFQPFSIYFDQLTSLDARNSTEFMDWYDPEHHSKFPCLQHLSICVGNKSALLKLARLTSKLKELDIRSSMNIKSGHTSLLHIFPHLKSFWETLCAFKFLDDFESCVGIHLSAGLLSNTDSTLLHFPRLKMFSVNILGCGYGQLDVLLKMSPSPEFLEVVIADRALCSVHKDTVPDSDSSEIRQGREAEKIKILDYLEGEGDMYQ